MESLGVEKTVDYHEYDWIEQILKWMPGGVDVAIAIQSNTSVPSMKVVKYGGKVIPVSGDIELTVENIYDFEDGLDALEKVLTRWTRGKSIIEIKQLIK